MTLPAQILAFKLLRKAYISKEERLQVLDSMNYDRDTLYEEAKKSLKKFKGNDLNWTSGSSSITLGPSFWRQMKRHCLLQDTQIKRLSRSL